MAHKIPRHRQPRRRRRTVIVLIIYRNARHAELIEDALAARAVAVAVACDAHLDIVVRDVRVKEGFDAGLVAELGVFDFTAGFGEFRHTDAEDVGWRRGVFGWHGVCVVCTVYDSSAQVIDAVVGRERCSFSADRLYQGRLLELVVVQRCVPRYRIFARIPHL